MRVLLIDDHAIVRDGLRRLLMSEFPQALVTEAADGDQAVEQVRTNPWDLVILDLSLPGRGGLDALKEIHALRPDAPVLVMTMHSEDQYALRAFRAGAAGYITKGNGVDEILQAVRRVRAGGKYVTPAIAEKLAANLARDDLGGPPHEALSNRELQVLRLLGAGKTVKEIGYELSLSEKTISTYRTRILEKMNLRTTAELIRYAIRSELVD
jgi:two-component system, NarL family, invasion response regulator UvrY